MKIYQIVYTKVPPEDSPWGKADFHTLFFPTDLMTKADVFELEKRIHFPDMEKFDRKETVFFQEISGRPYFIILHIQSLPEARDTFGRGGIFICHGFIFPPDLWKRVSAPSDLFHLAEDALFTSREEMLASASVDKKTGNILPLDVLEQRIDAIPTDLPKLSGEFEWKMALLLNRIANSRDERPSILLKGEPASISALMNRLLAYVPDDLKTSLGWDPAFDGGNLNFCPLKIAGFTDQCPTARNPVKIDMKILTIDENPETSGFFLPRTSYEKWLNRCREEALAKGKIEGAYRLSRILEGETSSPDRWVLPEKICFVSVNEDKIQDVFVDQCGRIHGAKITGYVASAITAKTMLDLIVDEFPPQKLAGHVEDAIFKNRLTREALGTPLSASLINAGSYRLKLVQRLWKEESLNPDDPDRLEKDQRSEFVKYLLLGGWAERDWIPDILKKDKEIFNHFLLSHETREIIEDILLRLVSKKKEFKKIAKIITNHALKQDRGFSLLVRETDLMDILEKSLEQWPLDGQELKTLISWSKKRKPPDGAFPYIRAFLHPKQGIPNNLFMDKATRDRLIECFMQYQQYTVRDLERLGFERHELAKIEERSGGARLFKKVKRFLKLGR